MSPAARFQRKHLETIMRFAQQRHYRVFNLKNPLNIEQPIAL